MSGVRVRFAAYIAMCLYLLGMSAAFAAPATASRSTSPALPPQVYVPITLQDANARTLTPALYIKSARIYEWIESDGSRTLYIVGEIENKSSIVFDNIAVHSQLFHDTGEHFVGGFEFPVLRQTFPDQTNPFAGLYTDVPADVNTFRFFIDGSPTGESRYVSLEVANSNHRDNQGIEIFGQIRNTTSDTILDTIVALTLYDEQGEVVDVDATSYDDDLQPGAMLPFTIATGNGDPSITDYLVQAQGLPPLPEENSVTIHQNLTNSAYRVQRPANAQILPWTP